MYSKKINQLATNLNPQNTDLLPIGDAETGQLKTTTFGSVSGITGDGVISGGIVTWTGTGLIFNISACTYILNGIRYSSPFSTKTLAAADPTNPRIDVFAVNTSGQVEVIQGTPNVNPVEPEGDTPTTLGLTNVTINAGATTPNGVTKDLIYDENVESWTKTQSVIGSFNYNDTAFPYTGSKALLVTMSSGFADFRFSKATAMNITNFQSLQFAIRLNTAWTSNTALAVQFYNGTNLITNTYQITATNNVGFNRNLAGTYQLITIPLNGTLLKFTQNTFTAVRIYTFNAAATYRLDTIALNGGINNPTGGGTTSANSFGFVNGSTGSAASTQATDTLNVVGSGLITTSATGKTLTIASNQIATSSILGRVTASTGNIETLTGTQATTLLDTFTSSLKGLAPASGGGTTNFLRADGTWAAAGGIAIGQSITSATAGSVLFAGASGVLQQDNANFFWDDTNNRLGIGTTIPSHKLTVTGVSPQVVIRSGASTTTNLQLNADGANFYTTIQGFRDTVGALPLYLQPSGGNVGFGTLTDTGEKLQVNGTMKVTGAATFSSSVTAAGSITGSQFLASNTNGITLSDNAVGGFLSYGYNSGRTNAAGHNFYNGISTELMRLTSGGNLLLGTTTNSGEKLVVTGTSYFSDSVGIGVSPSYKLHVVTAATATRQTLSNISRTTANWVRFTNPQFSINASMGLILRVFPDSDDRQGAGIIASGGNLNGETNLALFVSSGVASSTSFAAYSTTVNGSAVGHSFYNGAGTTAMTLTSAGRLILGAGDTGELLQVNGTMKVTGDAYASTKAWVGTNETTSPGALTVYSTSAANQIRIVGTTPTTVYTDIFGSGTPTIVGAVGGVSTTNNFVTGTVVGDFVVTNQLTTKRLYCVSNTGGVYLATNATSWTANSDITLKNINSYITNAVDKLMNLSVINYHLKDDITKKEQIGLIAQEVKQVFPEIIEESEIGILGLRYTEIIPILVKAIQELKNEINNLKNK